MLFSKGKALLKSPSLWCEKALDSLFLADMTHHHVTQIHVRVYKGNALSDIRINTLTGGFQLEHNVPVFCLGIGQNKGM